VANFANQVANFSIHQINFKLSCCFLYFHVHNCNVLDLILNLHPLIVMIVLDFKKKNTRFLSVITLRLTRTKKTHTSSV